MSPIPDIPADGNIRVSFLTAVSNLALPTTTELNAGLLLTSTATASGLIGWEAATASIPNRKLNSTFDSVDVGSVSIDESTIEFYKQSGTDSIFTTLTKGTAGFVVIRRSISSATAWATGQLLVGTFPVKCSQRTWVALESNTMERWRMPFKITAEPAFDSVVA